ncbi:sodium:solute symporter family protein [Maricurvus nonylphenolicus]|uniref:sodium:solute symporter family transporter n=1 Tax=Maricurvus nonylphenolicus TaxID=1008307 RepID=UPI0036F23DA9
MLHSAHLYSLTGFFIFMLAIALWARRKVNSAEDFIIAGRQLSMPLLVGTLIATWFGAGSLSVSADTIFQQGLQMTALEPLGLGFCLIFAGCFYARRIWHLQALTLADIIRHKFGPLAEKLEVMINLAYLGWIATQLLALGHIIELVFGFDATTSILFVTLILTAYTLLGGIWSVTLTDIVQVSLLVIGLLILCINILDTLVGGAGSLSGMQTVLSDAQTTSGGLIPTENLEEFRYWLSLFILGSLGNIASQDLTQRILAAKTPTIAVRSCLVSGLIYLVIGSIPVIIGLAGRLLISDPVAQGIIPLLAENYLSPWLSVIFMLAMTAAITSSVDSAMLAPASIFSKNLLAYYFADKVSALTLTRLAVIAVACASAALAMTGTQAIDLLQSAYTLGLTPFVILTFALYQKQTYTLPAVLAMLLGLLLWFHHIVDLLMPGRLFALPFADIPLPLSVLGLTLTTYILVHLIMKWRGCQYYQSQH